MPTDSLDYSGYDFDTALTQLEEKLALLDAWKDRGQSATGQILTRLIAYLIDMDGYKIDRRAEEQYINFARLRSSVVALAALVDYEARRKVGAVTTLRFTSPTAPMVIPKETIVASGGGVRFVTTAQGSVTIPNGYVDLTGRQGDPKSLSFTSDSSRGQAFSVPSTGDDVEVIESASLVVAVAGTEWTEVASFVGQSTTAQVYTVTRKSSTLKIEFGDRKTGAIPANGVAIVISWLETLGVDGNVTTVGAITTVVSSGLTGVTVTNTEVASGGEDEEGIEEIRTNAPQVFAAGDRAVTPADYRALLLAYPGVAKATAYGEQEVLAGAVTNPDYAWRVELVIVPEGGGVLTGAQEDLIEAYLDLRRVMTAQLTFLDPTYVPTDFIVQAKIGSAYDITTIETAIETALDALVNFQGIDLGEALRFSDVVAAVEGVTGVESSVNEVFATKNAGTGAGAKTVFASTDAGVGNIPVTPIEPGNMWVYIETIATGERRRVGYDDGSGSWTSAAVVANPRVTGGTVDYDTGTFSITLNAVVTALYRVIIRYQTMVEDTKVFGVGTGAVAVFTGVLEPNLSPNNIDIYREGILVGSDDGAGALVDAGNAVITGGSVDYTSGDIQVTFVANPDSGQQISSIFYRKNADIEVSVGQMILMGIKDVSAEEAS